MIEVSEQLSIPEEEVTFTASRGGGPGGQHVNKVSTRVALLFDVARSPSLDDEQRARILDRLANRISREGILRVVSQKHRSQEANRRAALERFVEILREALARRTPRRPTRPTRASRAKRIEAKKRRSDLKKTRSRVPPDGR